MIMTKDQIAEFEVAARPLIKFLNRTDIFHPHVEATVHCAGATISEGVASIKVEDYIQD
jgi:hypothetical protein